MQFYHSIITRKSFNYLKGLKRKYDFILIGGWAVFLYTRALKSKDIDIIIDYPELARMKEKYDVFKNERLNKYEIKVGEFDIDIYLDHYSNLGINVGSIKKNITAREGFLVPNPEMLFLLKLFAWEKRRGSAKGQKDELDILSLAVLPEFDWKKYQHLTASLKFGKYHQLFLNLLKNTNKIKELAINEQKMPKIKKNILGNLEK